MTPSTKSITIVTDNVWLALDKAGIASSEKPKHGEELPVTVIGTKSLTVDTTSGIDMIVVVIDLITTGEVSTRQVEDIGVQIEESLRSMRASGISFSPFSCSAIELFSAVSESLVLQAEGKEYRTGYSLLQSFEFRLSACRR